MPLEINKKLLFAIGFFALVIIAVLLATGVIPGIRKNIKKVPLIVWGFDDERVFQPLIQNYKKINPAIAISYRQLSPASYENDLVNGLATGNGPDIFMIENTWLPKHGNKLMPAPLDIITSARVEELFPMVIRQDFTAQETVYALPLYIDTLALLYNKDLFDKNGIALPPGNWLDFQDLARKLGKGSAAIGGSGRTIKNAADILALLMMQSGMSMVDEGGRAQLTNGASPLSFYTKFGNPQSSYYIWNNQLPSDGERFSRGTLSMLFGYYADLLALRNANPALRIGVNPMPQSSRATINYPAYTGLAVWSQSQHPKEAWQFIVFLTTQSENARAYLALAHKPPALRELLGEFQNDPDRAVFANQVLTARSWPHIDNRAIAAIFSNMIDLIQTNTLDINQTLKNAERAINELR